MFAVSESASCAHARKRVFVSTRDLSQDSVSGPWTPLRITVRNPQRVSTTNLGPSIGVCTFTSAYWGRVFLWLFRTGRLFRLGPHARSADHFSHPRADNYYRHRTCWCVPPTAPAPTGYLESLLFGSGVSFPRTRVRRIPLLTRRRRSRRLSLLPRQGFLRFIEKLEGRSHRPVVDGVRDSHFRGSHCGH